LGIWNWLRHKERPPLSGAPAVRRLKRHAAGSGYVYHYYYRGCRTTNVGTEYVFEITDAGPASRAVAVLLENKAVESWQRAHARELSAPERYAAAKLTLLRAMDQCSRPPEMAPRLSTDAETVAAVLAELGVD